MEQNNFTNQNLQTLGEQLTRIENSLVKPSQIIEERKTKPLFTPHEIPFEYKNELSEEDLEQKINKKLAQIQHIIDVVTVPDTPPQASKQIQTLSQLSDTEVEQIIDTFTKEP